MGTYEENWEIGEVVTAEAVFGIGLPPKVAVRAGRSGAGGTANERSQTEVRANETTD